MPEGVRTPTPEEARGAWQVISHAAASSYLDGFPPLPPPPPSHTAPPPPARTTCQGWRRETPHIPYSRPRARPSRRVSTRRAAFASLSKPAPPLHMRVSAHIQYCMVARACGPAPSGIPSTGRMAGSTCHTALLPRRIVCSWCPPFFFLFFLHSTVN
jgi:hypothetical protein